MATRRPQVRSDARHPTPAIYERPPLRSAPVSLVDFLDNSAAAGPVPGRADPRATRFHRSMPGYAPTAIAEAPAAAARLGLERLVVKLETERFGLPSFKLLGASWATCRALSRRLRRGDEPIATFDELRAALPAATG